MAVRAARPTWRLLRRVDEPTVPKRWASGRLRPSIPDGFGDKYQEALEELLALSLSSLGLDPIDERDTDFEELIASMGDAITSGQQMRALGLTADAEGRERLERAVRARSNNGDPRTMRELLRGERWASGVLGVKLFASLAPDPRGVIDL